MGHPRVWGESRKCGRASHDAHLSDDEAVAKMGYPVWWLFYPCLRIETWGTSGLKVTLPTINARCALIMGHPVLRLSYPCLRIETWGTRL